MTQPLCWCTYSTGSSIVDVTAGLLVAVAHHRRKGGRFSGARAADDDGETALTEHDVLQHHGQLKLFERGDLRIDEPDNAAGRALLHEGADAETADAGRGDREIALLGGIEFLRLPIVHDRAHERRGLLGRQGALALRADLAVDLDSRREARRDEQVRGFFLDDAAQQILHQLDRLIAIHRSIQSPCSEPCSAPPPYSLGPWQQVQPDTDRVSACPALGLSEWRSTFGQPCPRG